MMKLISKIESATRNKLKAFGIIRSSIADKLIADHDKFSNFVYLPLDKALAELDRRKNDKDLNNFVTKTIPKEVLRIFENSKIAYLPRAVSSPNYELLRFLSIVEAAETLTPVLGEYTTDKFNTRNHCKYCLGKLHFHFGIGKNKDEIIKKINIIDFNKANGKMISEISTIWGESLVDYHHQLLTNSDFFKKLQPIQFDASQWFQKIGGAKEFYNQYLCLFLRNGILFENFLLNPKEISFTREIFLPAFMKIYRETKYKPIIVALEPTDIEGEIFWSCYPPELYEVVKRAKNQV